MSRFTIKPASAAASSRRRTYGQGRSGGYAPQPGQQQAGRQRSAPEKQPEPELVEGLHQRLEGQHRKRRVRSVRVHEHKGQVLQKFAQAYPVQQPGKIHQRRRPGAAEKGQHRPRRPRAEGSSSRTAAGSTHRTAR